MSTGVAPGVLPRSCLIRSPQGNNRSCGEDPLQLPSPHASEELLQAILSSQRSMEISIIQIGRAQALIHDKLQVQGHTAALEEEQQREQMLRTFIQQEIHDLESSLTNEVRSAKADILTSRREDLAGIYLQKEQLGTNGSPKIDNANVASPAEENAGDASRAPDEQGESTWVDLTRAVTDIDRRFHKDVTLPGMVLVMIRAELEAQEDRLLRMFQKCWTHHAQGEAPVALEERDLQFQRGAPTATLSPVQHAQEVNLDPDLLGSDSLAVVTTDGQDSLTRQFPPQHSKSTARLEHDLREALKWTISKATTDEDSKVADMSIRQSMLRITRSSWFQIGVGLLIIANTVTIAVHADLSIKNALKWRQRKDEWSEPFSYVFTSLFTTELVIRLISEQWHFFYGSDAKWNVFDMVLVASALLELTLSTFNLSFLRILRAFRMLRILRAIRIIRVLRSLRVMVASILQSMITLTWAFVLFFLIMFVFSICFLQGAASYLVNSKNVSSEVSDGIEFHFTSLTGTLYTLIAVITGGEGWIPVAELLEKFHPMYKGLFLFFLFFTMFGVLNVLVAIFVESANDVSDTDKEQALHATLQAQGAVMSQFEDLCHAMDADGSGSISWSEFERHFQDPRVSAFFDELELDRDEARGIFTLLDWTDSGAVPFEEFIVGVLRLKGFAKSVEFYGAIFDKKKHAMMQIDQFQQLSSVLNKILSLIPPTAHCYPMPLRANASQCL